MALDDAFAHGQPDAIARVFLASVQALEGLKNPVGVLRFDADAIVADGNAPLAIFFAGFDLDAWLSLVAELNGVADQVLE